MDCLAVVAIARVDPSCSVLVFTVLFLVSLFCYPLHSRNCGLSVSLGMKNLPRIIDSFPHSFIVTLLLLVFSPPFCCLFPFSSPSPMSLLRRSSCSSPSLTRIRTPVSVRFLFTQLISAMPRWLRSSSLSTRSVCRPRLRKTSSLPPVPPEGGEATHHSRSPWPVLRAPRNRPLSHPLHRQVSGAATAPVHRSSTARCPT